MQISGEWPRIQIYHEENKILAFDEISKTLENEIDNTGNVRVWPSEEFLAVWCLVEDERWKDKSVLELGAGKSGLAGLAISSLNTAKSVIITDGNEECVQNKGL